MTEAGGAKPLKTSLLSTFSNDVAAPRYDRSKLTQSIVHVGVGGFHRAHLATYIDELAAAGNTDWAIFGCGVMPGDQRMADALLAQDCLYTLITRGADTIDVQVVGSIVDYKLADPDPQPVISKMAAEETQIISLTVTEGGYPVDDLTGEYLPDSRNAGPTSAFGLIAAALDERRRTHAKPITIMSCDNIMGNGHVAESATRGEAARFGDDLLAFIDSSVKFPNSMVDRITPATSDSDRSWLADQHDIADRWPVVTEPFRQWVIEDNFAGKRPPLEQLDIIVTDNVEPYEFMKLRLLNASHSCLSYLAALDGIETVDQAMAQPWISNYVRTFLDIESKPVLPPVAGIDIDDYNDSLIERFSNPAIGDQISRLALDGTAKFPKFLLPTVRAQVEAGGPLQLAALALAGWAQYLGGVDDHGTTIELANDPLLTEAKRYAELSRTEPAAFLDFTAVFGEDLRDAAPFRAAFVAALEQLRTNGAQATVESFLNGGSAGGKSNS